MSDPKEPKNTEAEEGGSDTGGTESGGNAGSAGEENQGHHGASGTGTEKGLHARDQNKTPLSPKENNNKNLEIKNISKPTRTVQKNPKQVVSNIKPLDPKAPYDPKALLQIPNITAQQQTLPNTTPILDPSIINQGNIPKSPSIKNAYVKNKKILNRKPIVEQTKRTLNTKITNTTQSLEKILKNLKNNASQIRESNVVDANLKKPAAKIELEKIIPKELASQVILDLKAFNNIASLNLKALNDKASFELQFINNKAFFELQLLINNAIANLENLMYVEFNNLLNSLNLILQLLKNKTGPEYELLVTTVTPTPTIPNQTLSIPPTAAATQAAKAIRKAANLPKNIGIPVPPFVPAPPPAPMPAKHVNQQKRIKVKKIPFGPLPQGPLPSSTALPTVPTQAQAIRNAVNIPASKPILFQPQTSKGSRPKENAELKNRRELELLVRNLKKDRDKNNNIREKALLAERINRLEGKLAKTYKPLSNETLERAKLLANKEIKALKVPKGIVKNDDNQSPKNSS